MTADTPALTPYVSRLALEWAVQEPDRRWREIEATFCLVDISGFTALSERLAVLGRVGAEELTIVLGRVFGELLDVAHEQGGTLVKFGGDALLLAFDGERHAERGCWAAIGMRQALRRVGRVETAIANVRLRMSVGLHSGSFQLYRVGHSHHELIVTGPAASTTTLMEGAAAANEIMVSDAVAAQVDASFVQVPKAPGLLLRDRRSWVDGPGPTAITESHQRAAAGEMPAQLRTHLRAVATEPEHRIATIGFVKFIGTDALLERDGPDAVAAALDELVRVVQDAADDELVTFLASDIDADGGKIILTTGVPVTREDDEGRMLRAARRIVEAGTTLDVKVGINRGHVFAGEVGTALRRTYTVIGDPVNVAARVMAAAGAGRVYATPAVVERSRSSFDTTELEPFEVKGKTEPVHAVELGALRREAASGTREDRLEFTGRDRELDALLEVVETVRRTGGHRSIEIVGDVGAGKSRLARELLARCDGFRRLSIRAEPYWTSTPYLPMRLLLRRLLPGEGLEPAALAERLGIAVSIHAPELAPWLPLLGEILAIDVPGTPEVARLDARARRERRDRAGAQLILALMPDRAVLTVEDVHWLDQPSRGLLQQMRVEGSTAAWLLITTSRPPGTTNPDVERFELRSLSDDAIRQIVNAATDDDPLNPHDVDTIVDRAGGNPLFCGELLRAIRLDRDLEHLPDSLDAVASASIDALPPTVRIVLRYAAVLGTTFRRRALEQLVAGDVGELDEATTDLLSQFLTADGPDLLRFRSRVLRDAAYQGLSYRRRRELHARAAAHFEDEYAERLDAYAELLATHFHAAGIDDKAWRYARRAGDLAADADANAEAAALYRLALDAARRLDLDAAERADTLERLGDTGERAGLYERATDAYKQAAELHADDPLEVGKLLLKRVKMGVRTERGATLTRLVRRADRIVDGIGTADAARLRAELLAWQAMVRRRQGRHAEAVELATRAAEQAEAIDAPHALALALNIVDWVSMESGTAGAARFGERVVDIYHRLGDRQLEGNALTNLGAFAYFEGDWRRARELYEQAAATFVDGGCLSAAAFADGNLGELLVNQGRLEEAEPRLRAAFRTLRAANDFDGAGFAAQQLGRIASASGRPEDADHYFDEAFRLWESIGDARGMMELRLRQAEGRLQRGGTTTATTWLAAIGPTTPWEEGVGWIYDRLDALRLAADRRLDEARAILAESLNRADGGGPFERFQLLDSALSLAGDDPAAPAWRDERDQLAVALDIVDEGDRTELVSASAGPPR